MSKTLAELQADRAELDAKIASERKVANASKNARKRAAKALDKWHDKHCEALTLDEDTAATTLIESLDPPATPVVTA